MRSFDKMMLVDKSLYQTRTFPVEGSKKCACIIAGYRGKMGSYKKVIHALNRRGYTVVAYEHDPSVLMSGDPAQLLSLVDEICNDFAQKAASFNEIICMGASIGAGLCFAVQARVPHIRAGIYAGAGVSPPDTIFEAPLFYFARRNFRKNGYTASELKKAWDGVDILPAKPFSQTPFVMVLGKRDKIVPYDKAMATLRAWRSAGQPIKVVTKANFGHLEIIRWYKNHIEELLTESENLKA